MPVKVKIKVNYEEIIEIDWEDLRHESVDDYVENYISWRLCECASCKIEKKKTEWDFE